MFSYIRTQYRHTSQKVEAMRRQIAANPEAFKSVEKEKEEVKASEVADESIPATGEGEAPKEGS